MRSSRTTTFSPSLPLRRLRTAFSSPDRSRSSTPTSSTPLSNTSTPSSSRTPSRIRGVSPSSSISSALSSTSSIRYSPSSVDREMAEERVLCSGEELGLLEPRPELQNLGVNRGFEEVLRGF